MKRIYTRRGDAGTTGIFGGVRVPKDDMRIEANGTLDELNAALGVVRSMLDVAHEWQPLLRSVQIELMAEMSLVATPSEQRAQNPNKPDGRMVAACEAKIDELTAQITDSDCFVLPGGTPLAARLQLARTIARRAERRLWTLHRQDPLPQELLCFINRLSDLLFIMARFEMQRQAADEERWQLFSYKRKRNAAPGASEE